MAAIDKALQAITNRRDNARESLIRRAQLPTPELYAGDRKVRRVGAVGGYLGRNRPKRTNRSIGESATSLVNRLGTETDQLIRAQVSRVLAELQRVANRRGVLAFQGDESTNGIDDPNDEANEGEDRAYQQYDNQLVVTGDPNTSGEGALYRHIPATATEPEKFVPVAMEVEINGDIPAPSASEVFSVRARATYRMVVISFYVEEAGSAGSFSDTDGNTARTSGSATFTLSAAIGQVIDVGDSLTVTATATDGTRAKFTVGCRKL